MVRFWMFITSVFLILTIMGGVFDESIVDLDDDDTALNKVMQLTVFSFKGFEIGGIPIKAPVPNTSFFAAATSLGTWNFNFFEGDLNIVRWMLWLPLTAGVIFTSVVTIGPVAIQAAGTLRNMFRL